MRGRGLKCVCSSCEGEFVLHDTDCLEDPQKADQLPRVGLTICGCESAGVYLAYVRCPHCKYEHEVY